MYHHACFVCCLLEKSKGKKIYCRYFSATKMWNHFKNPFDSGLIEGFDNSKGENKYSKRNRCNLTWKFSPLEQMGDDENVGT
jgi:hypothetical protein